MSEAVPSISRRLATFLVVTLAIQSSLIAYGEWLRHKRGLPFGLTELFSSNSVEARLEEFDPMLNLESDVLENEAIDLANEAELALNSTAPVTSATTEATETPTESAPELLDYRVQSGDTLSHIWVKHGASRAGALKAATEIKRLGLSLNIVRVGDTVRVGVSPEGADVHTFEVRLRDGRTVRLTGSSADGYTGQIIEPDIVAHRRTAAGTIDVSFIAAARAADVPYDVADQIVDLFGHRFDFYRDVQPGDTFSVTFEDRRLADGTPVPGGEVVHASFMTGGKLLAAIHAEGKDGQMRYFDEQGEPSGRKFLRYPVKFSRISSVFSDSRLHPVLRRVRPHNGVDFAAPIGTPVRAVADGVITVSGYRGGAGNMVTIRHDDRYSTSYLHLHKITTGIRPGVRVSRGQLIGTVGKTGLATGPHLHFSLYDRGRYVDPMRVVPHISVDPEDRLPQGILMAALDEIRGHHQSVLVAKADSAKKSSVG